MHTNILLFVAKPLRYVSGSSDQFLINVSFAVCARCACGRNKFSVSMSVCISGSSDQSSLFVCTIMRAVHVGGRNIA